ncbi:hypothetical protein Bca101_100325 [Brassica carinata]
MCWVAWDTLTRPKAKGRLGLRDIQLFNQALLAKVAWRILTVPNCLLSRILLGKYCHNKSFLEVSVPSVCSHGWRSILHGLELLKSNLGKVIGNGQTTKVWQDSWISLSERVKPIGPCTEAVLDLRVSDLLTTDLRWNKQTIAEILPEMAAQIQSLRPSTTGAADIYVWQPLQSGIYSTKSGYATAAALRQPHTQQAEEQDFLWNKDVWSGKFSLKLKVFLWSIIQNAIPIGENLQRRGITADLNCPRCKEQETPMHLFFSCPFTKKAWEFVPLKQAVIVAVEDTMKTMLVKFRSAICLPPQLEFQTSCSHGSFGPYGQQETC